MTVVAEGVESQQVWDRLASIGCDVAQGYLVSVPMPMRQLPS
jgi:EAL domain-containing protein (putative c-di-GMP-specific phosphodiesterase class I)